MRTKRPLSPLNDSDGRFLSRNYYINKDRTLNKFATTNGGFLLVFVLFLFRVVCMSFNYLMLTPPVVLLSSGWLSSKVSPLAGYTVRKMPYEMKRPAFCLCYWQVTRSTSSIHSKNYNRVWCLSNMTGNKTGQSMYFFARGIFFLWTQRRQDSSILPTHVAIINSTTSASVWLVRISFNVVKNSNWFNLFLKKR